MFHCHVDALFAREWHWSPQVLGDADTMIVSVALTARQGNICSSIGRGYSIFACALL